jgi:hypothetical protein
MYDSIILFVDLSRSYHVLDSIPALYVKYDYSNLTYNTFSTTFVNTRLDFLYMKVNYEKNGSQMAIQPEYNMSFKETDDFISLIKNFICRCASLFQISANICKIWAIRYY